VCLITLKLHQLQDQLLYLSNKKTAETNGVVCYWTLHRGHWYCHMLVMVFILVFNLLHGLTQTKLKICTKAPLTIDMTQIMKTGIIHFLCLPHIILEGPFSIQNPIIMIPKIHAIVPNTACDHTVNEATSERDPNSSAPPIRLGIITIKIEAVCSISAAKVEYPWRIKFFWFADPLDKGNPKINKNKTII
jgi:hypothetical protein